MNPDPCQTGADENVLTLDVPDAALERAAGSSGAAALTWNFCTYQCGPIGERT